MGYMVAVQIHAGIDYFVNIASALLAVYMLLTWIARPNSPAYRFVSRLVQPLLAPFRPLSQFLIRNGFLVDLTALFAILALQVLARLAWELLLWATGSR